MILSNKTNKILLINEAKQILHNFFYKRQTKDFLNVILSTKERNNVFVLEKINIKIWLVSFVRSKKEKNEHLIDKPQIHFKIDSFNQRQILSIDETKKV